MSTLYLAEPEATSRDRGKLETAERLPDWYLRVKPVLDWFAAATLLVLAAPVVFLAFLAVRLTSAGPVLYSQIRLGRDGREFRIYKVRSMFHRCEGLTGPVWSNPKGDPRVTPVGALLRMTHLDELPQLWNVLRGEMSLVGPRPERPAIARELAKALPDYERRLLVRPGLTGLAQIQLPPDTDLASVERKLACDLHYVRHQDWSLDARILFGTATYLLGIPFSFSRDVLGTPSYESIVASDCAGDPAESTELPTVATQAGTA
jgi:lipopolysaccharide/colanic/teichoic acid biosynthesis glycosyltransferase